MFGMLWTAHYVRTVRLLAVNTIGENDAPYIRKTRRLNERRRSV